MAETARLPMGYVILGLPGLQRWCGKDQTLYTASGRPPSDVTVFPDLHAVRVAIRHAVKFWNQPRFRLKGTRRTVAEHYQAYSIALPRSARG